MPKPPAIAGSSSSARACARRGKRRFGKVGLTDKSGTPIFGMDSKGPVGKPEDVENYLRNLGAKDEGASLDVAVLPRKRKVTKVNLKPANDSGPTRKRSLLPA